MTDTDTRYFDPTADDGDDQGEGTGYDGPSEGDYVRDEYTTAPFSLLDAPDYANFLRHPQSAQGKEYEERMRSMLKAAALTMFKNGQPLDGATILHYGPGFARKTGDLTDISDSARKAIDLLTAPDNPWFAFVIAGMPFAMQFFRNHEREAAEIGRQVRKTRAERKEYRRKVRTGELPPPPPRRAKGITIKGPFGRTFTVRIPIPKPTALLNLVRTQTHDPVDLATKVLSDPKVQKILAKEGIVIEVRQTNG